MHGDIILVDAPEEKIHQILATPLAQLKEIEILRSDYSIATPLEKRLPSSFKNRIAVTDIFPWGWDPAICHEISEKFPHLSSRLSSPSQLEEIRRLSHRRLTIDFNRMIAYQIKSFDSEIIIPCEVKNVEEAMALYDSHPDCFFKAPWSSSGRGVMQCLDLERDKHIKPWVHGVIRHQGSVMWEKAADKALDFATEWMIEEGEVKFLGLSVFNASGRGKYHGNMVASDSFKTTYIEKSTPLLSTNLIEAQRKAIQTLIAPYYSGPVGVDMLADKDGKIRPCVEVNLRYTMGHAALRIQDQLASADSTLENALFDFLQDYDSLGLFQISDNYE